MVLLLQRLRGGAPEAGSGALQRRFIVSFRTRQPPGGNGRADVKPFCLVSDRVPRLSPGGNLPGGAVNLTERAGGQSFGPASDPCERGARALVQVRCGACRKARNLPWPAASARSPQVMRWCERWTAATSEPWRMGQLAGGRADTVLAGLVPVHPEVGPRHEKPALEACRGPSGHPSSVGTTPLREAGTVVRAPGKWEIL